MARVSWLLPASNTHKTCRRRGRLCLEELETRDVPSFTQLALDFDTATSPTAPGFTRVANPYYTSARGYGFKNTGTITAIDRGTADPLTRDFHQGRNETFNANMAKGWYVVSLYMGDAAAARNALDVNAEGSYATTVPATAAGQFVISRFVVQVRDSQLNLKFLGSATSRFALDGMTIVPWNLTANAGADASMSEGAARQFQGSASGQGLLSYHWNFGDGTTATGTLMPTKTYADQGTFTVTLTVTDAYGFQRSDTARVTVGNVAPTASISNSGPVNEGSSATVSLSDPSDPSSADVAAGFKYSFDFDNNGVFEVTNSSSATVTVPASYLVDGPGTRTLRARISDKDGAATTYTTTIAINNVAPTASFTVEVNDTTVNFSSSVSDPGTSDTFIYAWDFSDGAGSNQAAPSHTYGQSGAYTVTLTVTDKDGASVSVSKDVTIESPADTTAPTVSITSPANNASVSDTVNVQADAGDNVGVVGVQFYVDGQAMGAEDTSSPYAYSWDTTQVGNGTYALTAQGRDAAGNVTTSAAINVTVSNTPPDTTAPTVSITSPANNATVSATANVQADASDNVGVVGVQFYVDGQAVGAEDTSSPNAFSWDTTQVSNGTYALTAKARDAAGNVTTSAAVNVTVANTTSTGLVAAFGFNEGAGTTLGDSADNNDGTISGAAWASNGKFGKALSFDGFNDWVTINDAAALDLTTGMTLEAWVMPSTINGWETVVLKEASGELAYGLYADNNGNDTGGPRRPGFWIRQGNSSYSTLGNSQVPINTWTHLAATYDGAVQRLYVNGQLAGSLTRSGAINTTANALRIGGNSVWNEWFNGLIDEVRIYNRALSETEIQNDMNTPVEEPAPDTAAPNVAAVNPSDGAGNVNVGASVQITFSEAMDASTINDIQVQLRDSAGNVVAAAVTYSPSNFVATLNPIADLGYSASYTVSVQGVEDAAGNVLASAFSSSFTTAAAPPQDTTAPTVTSVNPATGASGVNAGISVQVTFSEAMDASTINGSQIRLRDSAGNVVAASVAYDSGNRSATLDPNSNLAYATSFTVSVEGVKDVAGNSLSGSFTSTFSTAAAPGAPGQFIVTPYDKIPSFGSNPTIVSASSGSWSNPSTWSTGVVPAANDIVSIAAGTTVTFDVVMTAADAVQTVAVQAGGKLTFRTDVNTTLFVSNLLVMTDGELNVGAVANPVAAAVKAQIIFANKPLDTTYDPEQYGNGLIALGKVTMVGAAKPDTFIRLAAEAFAGQTTLRLSQPATGWQVGDKLILPDSHQVTDFERNTNYQNQLEQPTISAISGDGLTITLSAPLAYNHLGARGINGSLDFLPHVANTSRSVVVRSESASGNRGHVLFTYRADVNVQYVQFAGLGRTRNSADDNTTFGSSGTVTHVGTNQEDRNPVQFRHLFGPTTPQANGFQYTFVGNSVTCPLNPMPFIWGINVNDSHYGLLKDNVLFNWAGASFVTKTGSETGNVIDHNMVVRTTGNALREDDDARAGSGFWFRGPNNYVRNNVATNINSDGDDIYNYGFNFYGRYVGTVNIPVAQGSDLSVASQRQARNMNNTPILQFENNEVYGATTSGLSLWWIGTFDDNFYADAQESVVKGFTVWHHGTTGLFSYPVNRVTLDGMVVRGNVNNLSDPNFHPMGIFFSDYMGHQLVVRNANIQGVATGIVTPYNVGRVSTMNTNVIENSYLANVVNISVSPPRSINGSGDLSPKRLEIRNVTFAHPTNVSPSRWADIDMDFVISDNSGTSNLNVADLVFVYDYNGNANDDFQVFYTERAPADAVIRSLIRGRVKSI